MNSWMILVLMLTVCCHIVKSEGEAEPVETEKKVQYFPPEISGSPHFLETFDDPGVLNNKWILSDTKKDDTEEAIAKYEGKWNIEEPKSNPLQGDLGLVLKSRAKLHAIAAKFTKPFEFTGQQLVVQYEVKFQEGMECGGAYIKLLSHSKDMNLKKLNDKTPYTIMFGPDKCGMDHKLHFILRHTNKKSGQAEEKHAKKPSGSLDGYFTDKKTHLFTLVIADDNSFEIYVDQELVNSGNLLEDMTPPVNPPKEIEDKNDKKPEDWDEREKIPDPDATKPDDWDETQPETIVDPDAAKPSGWLDDEPELIPDPEAEKPSDWDEDMDGEWEAPQISNPKCEGAPGCGKWTPPTIKNPKYKGKWSAPKIDNPNYKGKWKPRMIPNPDYYEDLTPYKVTPFSAVALELWTMTEDILFDNFIITDSKATADSLAEQTWALKKKEEEKKINSSGKSVIDAVMDAAQERPWLWAVIALVVILPVVLIVAYCCMSSDKPSQVDDIAARKKFDDEKTEAEEEKEEEKAGEEEKTEASEESKAGGDAGTGVRRRTKKSDLEVEEENKEGDDEEEEEEEEASESQSNSSPRKSPRKRKPRKD
ncbi:calnexin isoform X1 [Lingula anatina]|uniref:Calnexin isoform X1 n=1 Tax=Lingula anatina TaxID=7574 RepID=A0A1S3HTN8_LINAN|nr:calnexin isoform X1 [Lingula anatina]|eukprot:XP_013389410.1 calnexin isoform X1 [Lingula anatina]